MASNFLLAPLFTRFLSPVEYGLIALCSLFQNYLTIFLDVGLKGAFSRYYFRYFRKPAILKALFSTAIITVIVISGIVYGIMVVVGDALFAAVFKNELFTFQAYGHIVFALTVNALLNAIILTYYRNAEDIGRYAWVSLSTFFLMTIGAVIGVVVFRFGALGSMIGKATGVAIVITTFLVFFYKRNHASFSWRLLRPLLWYGYPLIPYALLNITIANLDRFFIERYFDLATLGQYTIAFLISTIPVIMLNAFQSSVNPAVMKALEVTKGNNYAEGYQEINSNFKLMMVVMVIMLWGMITFSGFFIMFYVGPQYRVVIEYLPILILAFIPLIYQNMFSILLFFHYQSKLLPIISLITLIGALASNFILIPILGIMGVAVAVVIKNLLFCMFTRWALVYKGFYNPTLFYLGRYHWLPVILASAALISLLLVHHFPAYYHLTNLLAGFIAGIFIFALFKTEFGRAIQFVRNRLNF